MSKDRQPRSFDNLRHPAREPDIEAERLAGCFNKCFSTHEGQIVLAHLRQLTVEVVIPADASDGALRMQEGKRQLQRTIEGLIASGGSTESKS